MRKAIFTVVFAVTAVVLTASAALAGGTYPPPPTPQTVTGSPTAFTGGDVSTPLKVMVGLVALALIAFAALMFTRRATTDE